MARRLPAGEFDLLVIGGGIVGSGVARDAAMRGLRTLLVEQGDFASGTSSRSSRLLHGGLRYLAQGRVGLVREASVEKIRLHQIAPHLAQPLAFVFPAWKGTGWPRWQLAIGVRLYDLLAGRNLGGSQVLSSAEVLELAPGARTEGLSGGVRYFDAFTNDARLVLDTLRSAEDAGATLVNYMRFVDCGDADVTRRCELRDELTGETCTINARAVVNAAGAWAGRIPHSKVRLRLTKGAHLVIDRARLPVRDAVVLPAGDRIVFVIPWGERAIIGTTDTDYAGDPSEVRPEATDIAYLLQIVNAAFPQSRIGQNDVVATWAGVRPLIAPRNARAGAPSDISRSHEIHMSEPGWFEVTGGKLTTYRLMAEQTVDRVCEHLGGTWRACATAATPLPSGPFSRVLPPAFGRDAVEYFCRHEWMVHLDDLLLRRASWHFYEKDTERVAREAVQWIAQDLGWDTERTEKELRRYLSSVWKIEKGT